MYRASLLLLPFLCSSFSHAQELRCRVIVNPNQVETTERGVFRDMEMDFTEFVNGRKWTDDDFEPEERINCNFVINITNITGISRFEATVQILSARPVYNTDYETLLFNYGDEDWAFDYIPSQPLQFNENAFTDNLTSLLAYYVYIILGVDYDSFEELGGTPYYQKAWQIVLNAQPLDIKGWQQFSKNNRNRYWLAENLLSNDLEGIRKAYYQYHRHGLDVLWEQPDDARKAVLESIKLVETADKIRPRSIFTIVFLEAKSDELAQIFSEGEPTKRKNAYNILTQINPAKSDIFEVIIK